MSDFVQTMKDWRRMCNAQDGSTCGACEGCPMMDDGASCVAVYEDDFDKIDFAHIESVITKWAAEHPEPVYPTWWDWLIKSGVINGCTNKGAIERLQMTTIPADIAQKLGIEPKEG